MKTSFFIQSFDCFTVLRIWEREYCEEFLTIFADALASKSPTLCDSDFSLKIKGWIKPFGMEAFL